MKKFLCFLLAIVLSIGILWFASADINEGNGLSVPTEQQSQGE